MPRYYRRRYTKVVRPKKKWATNLVNVATVPVTATNTALFAKQIAVNSTPTSTPTPVIVKTGNFKLQCDVIAQTVNPSHVQVAAYVVYVPEGMDAQFLAYNNAKDFIARHPEWVLCWKFCSCDYLAAGNTGNFDSIKVSSRLKRNLNSGDAIYFVCLVEAIANVNFSLVTVAGMCQYWTCAN